VEIIARLRALKANMRSLNIVWVRNGLFALSSLLCGLSLSVLQLILFRFLQGIGGAMVQSSARALAAEAVPDELGGRAQGYMTTAHHTGFLLGPSMGGLMIDYLSWRWTFFFLVPIGICGSLLALQNMKRRTMPGELPSIDYVGAALLFAATTTLILFFDRRTLAVFGTEARTVLAVVCLGCVLGLIFHESKAKSPFLTLSMFKDRMFAFSALSLAIISTCYTIPNFLLPFYMQNVLNLSPSFIGFLFMVPPIITVTVAPFTGHLTDRLGPRLIASVGVTFIFFALLIGVAFRSDSHWLLPTSMITFGAIANGIFNPANSMAMIGMTPKDHRGFATAVNHVLFSLGNVLGVSFGGYLMTAAFEYHSGLSGVSPTTEHPVGFVAALNVTFLTGAGLGLIGFMTSVARGRKGT